MLAISSGSVSIYPIYSYYMKIKFHYSLRQINLYGSFINIGSWIAFGMGIIYDKCGPKISNIIGFFLLPFCLSILYRLITSVYTSLSLIVFLVIAFILGQGSALLYTSALSTSIKNFSKKNSSNIVGLIASSCAVSPSIFASFKAAYDSMTIPNFIYFVIFYVSFYVILSFCLVDVVKDKRDYEFRDKVYRENKQYFIINLFSTINFIALLIFIITLIINNIFGIKLPAFIILPVFHFILLIVAFSEKCGKIDDILAENFDNNHRNNINNNNVFISSAAKNVPIVDKKENMINNNEINNNNDNKRNSEYNTR